MERWSKRVAVVTGASAGIGEALVKDLVRNNVIVVGLARRVERVEAIRKALPAGQQALLHPYKCDVTNEEQVKKAFEWVDKTLGGADIVVNNAGLFRLNSILSPGNTQDIRDTVETNIMGVVYCTREGYNSMKRRNIDGHVFLINSVAGHRVPDFGPGVPSVNIYPATKYAVTALTETYRQEFANNGTKIKVTSISPGAVDTEIFPKEMLPMKSMIPMLRPDDVSQAIIYALSTRPDVQVHDIILRPLGLDAPSAVRKAQAKN